MKPFKLSKSDLAFCRDILRTHSVTYYNSTRLFPNHIQPAVFALYAWVRTADELVDNPRSDPIKALEKFEKLYEQTKKTGKGPDRTTNIFIKLAQAREFGDRWPNAFLESMKLDLNHPAYKTPEELECYIFGSAEVIGLMMARIMGVEKKYDDAARRLGYWMQEVNFLRDIREDYDVRNRTYVPTSKLKQFGLTQKNMFDTFKRKKLLKLIKSEAQRLLDQIPTLKKELLYIPKESRMAVDLSVQLYSWTISRIRQNPSIPLNEQLKPSRVTIMQKLLFTRIRYIF